MLVNTDSNPSVRARVEQIAVKYMDASELLFFKSLKTGQPGRYVFKNTVKPAHDELANFFLNNPVHLSVQVDVTLKARDMFGDTQDKLHTLINNDPLFETIDKDDLLSDNSIKIDARMYVILASITDVTVNEITFASSLLENLQASHPQLFSSFYVESKDGKNAVMRLPSDPISNVEAFFEALSPPQFTNGFVTDFVLKRELDTAWGKLQANIERFLRNEEIKSVLQHQSYGLDVEAVDKLKNALIMWGQNRLDRRSRHPTYRFLRRVAGVIGERVERYYDHPHVENDDEQQLKKLLEAHLEQRGADTAIMEPELIQRLVSDPEVSGNYRMTCEVQAALEEVYSEFILRTNLDQTRFTINMLLNDDGLSMQFAALAANTIKKNRHTEPKKFYKDQELKYIDKQITRAWKFVGVLLMRTHRLGGVHRSSDPFALLVM